MANEVPRLVPVEYWCSLLSIGLQSNRDGTWIVIRPLFKVPSLGQTGHDLVIGHIEEQHRTHAPTLFRQQTLYALGLGNRPHHTIEDYPVSRCRLAQLLANDPENEVITYQVTCLHELLGLDSQRSSSLHRIAQQISRCELGYAALLGQQCALGALARARRAHQ